MHYTEYKFLVSIRGPVSKPLQPGTGPRTIVWVALRYFIFQCASDEEITRLVRERHILQRRPILQPEELSATIPQPTQHGQFAYANSLCLRMQIVSVCICKLPLFCTCKLSLFAHANCLCFAQANCLCFHMQIASVLHMQIVSVCI